MHRIVFLDRATIGPSVDLKQPRTPHEWQHFDRTAPDQVRERLREADIAITNKAPVRRETIDALPNLKAVVIAATGYDVVDTEACKARGIPVCNVRRYATASVPEHAFALILALTRSIVGYRQDVIAGEWQKAAQFCFFNHQIRDLRGAVLGIMGEGAIGQSLADIGKAFGMIPLFAAHKGVEGLGPLYTPFEEVLERSDVISLHCPLTPQTKNMLAMPEFRKMTRQPILVNTARGGLVDEHDLVKALDEGLIAGFGFDTLTSEPPVDDHPFLAVLDRPNVIVTPHVAWASDDAMQILWDQVIEMTEAFMQGEPFNRVV
ncbi:MAG: D-2-hydroxyacid dehydrogenase [Pseudomonadota bacterium]